MTSRPTKETTGECSEDEDSKNAGESKAGAGTDIDFSDFFERTLTRGKVKALLQTHSKEDVSQRWPTFSPMKIFDRPRSPSGTQFLITAADLPEDSDDEEYIPENIDLLQMNNDDFSSVVSHVSSTCNPPTTQSARKGSGSSSLLTPKKRQAEAGLFTGSASPGCQRGSGGPESVFKAPSPLNKRKTPNNPIGLRTRSKLPLNDTPLEHFESQFIPPDITTDMYDWGEIDDNYKEFITGFFSTMPQTAEGEDDQETDPEYNVMEEELDDLDKEELRRDRGVAVTKKELNDLVAELMEGSQTTGDEVEDLVSFIGTGSSNLTPHKVTAQSKVQKESNEGFSTQTNDKAQTQIQQRIQSPSDQFSSGPAINPESSNSTPRPLFSTGDLKRLRIQMECHIQLLAQTFVMTASVRNDRDCQKLAASAKTFIMNLHNSSKDRGVGSIFTVRNIGPAVNVIQSIENITRSPIKKKILANNLNNLDYQNNTCHSSTWPYSIVKIICESEAFMFGKLLPGLYNQSVVEPCTFFPSEDCLTALGLDTMKDWSDSLRRKADYLQLILPARSGLQIYERIRNLNKTRTWTYKSDSSGPLLKYLKDGTVPTTPQIENECNFMELLYPIAPINQPMESLTHQWRTNVQNLRRVTVIKLNLDKQRIHKSSRKDNRENFNDKEKYVYLKKLAENIPFSIVTPTRVGVGFPKKLVNSKCGLSKKIDTIDTSSIASKLASPVKGLESKPPPQQPILDPSAQTQPQCLSSTSPTNSYVENQDGCIKGQPFEPNIVPRIRENNSARTWGNYNRTFLNKNTDAMSVSSSAKADVSNSNLSSNDESEMEWESPNGIMDDGSYHEGSDIYSTDERSSSEGEPECIDLSDSEDEESVSRKAQNQLKDSKRMSDMEVEELVDSGGEEIGRSGKKRYSKYNTSSLETLLEVTPQTKDEVGHSSTEAFMDKVQRTIETEGKNPGLFQTFARTLCHHEDSRQTQAELYYKVENLLKEYPDLVREFGGFLDVNEAMKVGRFVDQQETSAQLKLSELLEKWTENAPHLKSRILQRIRGLREDHELTLGKIATVMETFFSSSPIMQSAFKAVFPSYFRLHTSGSSVDYEVIDRELENEPNSSSSTFEVAKLQDETTVPAASTCPCTCHINTSNVPMSIKLKHCNKWCLNFQEGQIVISQVGLNYIKGKVYVHSGRVMKPVTSSYVTSEVAKNITVGETCGTCLKPNRAKISTTTGGTSTFSSPSTGSHLQNKAQVLEDHDSLDGDGGRDRDHPQSRSPKIPTCHSVVASEASKVSETDNESAPWTIEEDRCMITAYKSESSTERVHQKLYEMIPHRSASEITSRINELMEILKNMSSATRESLSKSSDVDTQQDVDQSSASSKSTES